MPTYTAPTTRTTGELISAAIFNTDLVENIKYFKDAPAFAGNVTVGGTLGVTGLITSTGGITGGASSHTTGAFSSTVTGGTYNGQTISSAANFTGTLGVAGLLTVSGFGTNLFSATGTGAQIFKLKNEASAATNQTVFMASTSTFDSEFGATSAAFTPGSGLVASGTHIYAAGSGGFSMVAAHASGAIRLYSGGSTLRWTIGSDGTLTGANNIIEIGASTYRATGSSGTAYMGYVTAQTAFEILFNSTSVGVKLTSGANAWAALSDARLKTTLTPFTDAAATLRGVRTGTGRYLTDDPEISRSFMLAQDFLNDLPEAVTRDEKDGMLVLRYTDTIPLIISGWQQHDATITQLAARIAALESQDN